MLRLIRSSTDWVRNMSEPTGNPDEKPTRWSRYKAAFSLIVSILFGAAILIHLTEAYGHRAQDIAEGIWEEVQYFNPFLVENDYALVVIRSNCHIEQTYGRVKVDSLGDQILPGILRNLRTDDEIKRWSEELEKGRQVLSCPKINSVGDALETIVRDISNIPHGYWRATTRFLQREGAVGYSIAIVALLIPLVFR